jgi:hypothetical protein
VSGDTVDVVAGLKKDSDVPLRSHGSLSLNWALIAAGLVDRVQVTLFPVITGRTAVDPIFRGCGRLRPGPRRAPDLDGHAQQLVYRRALRGVDPGGARLVGRRGIDRRPSGTAGADCDREELVALYEAGWSAPAIADHMGCSSSTIYRRLATAGIARRPARRG